MEPSDRESAEGRRSLSTDFKALQWSRGPESAEGGILRVRGRLAVPPRFNGAADRSPRKAGRLVAIRYANGASMEPRTGVRGRNPSGCAPASGAATGVRGRSREHVLSTEPASMEPRTGVRGRLRAWLQWSRGPESAGVTETTCCDTLELQWSRGPESAEGMARTRSGRLRTCAGCSAYRNASMEPRTGVRGRPGIAAHSMGARSRSPLAASMEPRTGVRGRTFGAAPDVRDFVANGAADRSPRKEAERPTVPPSLQWSRGPESAEGRRTVKLQWRRTGVKDVTATVRGAGQASMEPRTGVRGRPLRRAHAVIASMEPRTGVRGRCCEAQRTREPPWASMEPRTGVRGRDARTTSDWATSRPDRSPRKG